jgi:hypothetical protein
MRIGRLAPIVVFSLLGLIAAEVAEAADAGTARRPRPLVWADETVGWVKGAAIRIERPAPAEGAGIPSETSNAKYASAFLVAPNGTWLTARKNIEQCRSISVEAGASGSALTRLMVIEVSVHESADVALVRTAGFRMDIAPVPMAPVGLESEQAFQVGFANGKPAAIHSRLIGYMPPRRPGVSSEDDVAVWGELSRVPDSEEDSGALSGGIVMNEDRLGFGVVSGERARRGRVLTSSNDAIRALLRRERVTGPPMVMDDLPPLTNQTYPPVARALIQERRVARLVCEPRTGSQPTPTRPR